MISWLTSTKIHYGLTVLYCIIWKRLSIGFSYLISDFYIRFTTKMIELHKGCSFNRITKINTPQ